jgi:hypothetical protein
VWSGVGWRPDGYGFDDVTRYDVRYREQSQVISNSWTGAKVGEGGSFKGDTQFARDVNGNLLTLTRSGRNKHYPEVTDFTYDIDGQIATRARRTRSKGWSKGSGQRGQSLRSPHIFH